MSQRSSRSEDFARRHLMGEGETLHRYDPQGPFVAALVELSGGGFIIRIGQPSVIERGRSSSLPDVVQIGPWGPSAYSKASRRFNKLIDEELA